MATRRQTLTDQIRAAVDSSGMSRYRIAKKLGIAESGMSRFMSGAGLGLDVLDRLAALLRLKIVTDDRKVK